MQAVSNATPLIYLAKIGKLYLLEKIFESVLIPVKVFSEVVMSVKEKGYHDAYLVEEFVEKGLIVKREGNIKKLKNIPIGRGEAETIELAAREGIKDVLIDEAKNQENYTDVQSSAQRDIMGIGKRFQGRFALQG